MANRLIKTRLYFKTMPCPALGLEAMFAGRANCLWFPGMMSLLSVTLAWIPIYPPSYNLPSLSTMYQDKVFFFHN